MMQRIANAKVEKIHQNTDEELFAISVAKDIVVTMIASKLKPFDKAPSSKDIRDNVFDVAKQIHATMKTDWSEKK